jgi:hypothetical protein
MAFWNTDILELENFRIGIMSKAELDTYMKPYAMDVDGIPW